MANGSNEVAASAAPTRITRRRFDQAWKQAIVQKALQPGVSIAKLARDHDLNANQVFKWCRIYEQSKFVANPAHKLVPVSFDAMPCEAAGKSVSLTIEMTRGHAQA